MDDQAYVCAREAMVEFQLRRRGIADEGVLAAMGALPRELFVPPELADSAYDDCALPIGEEQTISQPYMVALMSELLAPHAGMQVLEVGTGSGYGAAVLAAMGAQVVSLERHAALASAARARLETLGLGERVRIIVGDGTEGWTPEAPYEGIIVTAAVKALSGAWWEQLAPAGRIVAPVGTRSLQMLTVSRAIGSERLIWQIEACVFVPLIGTGGFSE